MVNQLLALALSFGLCSFKESENLSCPQSTSGTFSVYDYNESPLLSPAPEGFKPLYISYFGRHGARYCTSEYDAMYDWLLQADQKKLLTDEGRDFFARYETFYQNVRNFKGNLTGIGKGQLKAIADHMFNRFPEVFEGPTSINASSTESPRVIMSMWSCLSQLQALDSDIVIDANASASFAPWLQPSLPSNPNYYNNGFKCGPVAEAAAKEYFLKTVPWKKIISRYFKSQDVLPEHLKVNPDRFIGVLAAIVFGSECLDNNNDCFDDVLSPGEKLRIWKWLSADYFISNARFKDSKRISVDYAAFTLAQIIETAQNDIESGKTNLRLRFSHDSSIAPLLVFLDINGCGRETDSLEESLKIFPSYNIPMGASLQLVFYKNKDGKIILRVLLNEREAILPITPYSDTFYSWEDFKTYYLPLIEASVQKIKSEKTFSQAEWNWRSIGVDAFVGHADMILFGANQSISVLRYRADKFKTFVANDSGEYADSTSALALKHGGIAAINASFFDANRRPITFVKDNGVQEGWTIIQDPSQINGIVGIKGNEVNIIPCDTVEYRKVTKKYRDAIASGPVILLNGREARRNWPKKSFYTRRHPRTFIGTTADGWVYLVVIDGRFPQQGVGTTIHETAEVARLLGLQNALNLDGGGSSVLWTKEYGTISYPYDNRRYDHFGQRIVPNIIYIK